MGSILGYNIMVYIGIPWDHQLYRIVASGEKNPLWAAQPVNNSCHAPDLNFEGAVVIGYTNDTAERPWHDRQGRWRRKDPEQKLHITYTHNHPPTVHNRPQPSTTYILLDSRFEGNSITAPNCQHSSWRSPGIPGAPNTAQEPSTFAASAPPRRLGTVALRRSHVCSISGVGVGWCWSVFEVSLDLTFRWTSCSLTVWSSDNSDEYLNNRYLWQHNSDVWIFR